VLISLQILESERITFAEKLLWRLRIATDTPVIPEETEIAVMKRERMISDLLQLRKSVGPDDFVSLEVCTNL
jgi:hypothetical protein